MGVFPTRIRSDLCSVCRFGGRGCLCAPPPVFVKIAAVRVLGRAVAASARRPHPGAARRRRLPGAARRRRHSGAARRRRPGVVLLCVAFVLEFCSINIDQVSYTYRSVEEIL